MRSIKTELYLFVKAMLLGGTYTDGFDEAKTFVAIAALKHMGFWNSELINPELKDNYPVFAVFFEFSNSDNYLINQKTNETSSYATTKDLVQFALHLISPKNRSEDRDEDYLEMIDLADLIYRRMQDRSAAGIQDIRRVREFMDINNTVLMDWQIVFNVNLTNCGDTDQVDANDPLVNPNEPVEVELIPILTKTT